MIISELLHETLFLNLLMFLRDHKSVMRLFHSWEKPSRDPSFQVVHQTKSCPDYSIALRQAKNNMLLFHFLGSNQNCDDSRRECVFLEAPNFNENYLVGNDLKLAMSSNLKSWQHNIESWIRQKLMKNFKQRFYFSWMAKFSESFSCIGQFWN